MRRRRQYTSVIEVIGAQKLLQRVRTIQVIPNAPSLSDAPAPLSSASEAPSNKLANSKVLSQYRELKEQHPERIILMQVGDFFEVFDQDAERVSQALEIGICNSRYRTQMTGFPIRNMESYLERLVKAGLPAVIVEQVETAEKMIKRQVTRIVTQGTLTEDGLLDSYTNNFILAIEQDAAGRRAGLAWIDLSTGYFRVSEVAEDDLHGELHRINPTELLVQQEGKTGEILAKYVRSSRAVFASIDDGGGGNLSNILIEFFGAEESSRLACFTPLEIISASKLLNYILATQIGKHPYIDFPRRHAKKSVMQLDGAALRSLEILKNNTTNNKENSLLDVLDETCTAAGSRLLAQQLSAPLLSADEIDQRLDQVQYFVDDPLLTDDLREKLRTCRDLERSFQRLTLGRNIGGPRDMLLIKQTLQSGGELKKLMREGACKDYFAIEECPALVTELDRALVDSPPSRASDGGVIREGYSRALDDLRQGSESLEKRRDAIVKRYKEETGKNSMKLSSRKTLGLLLEVNKSEGSIDDPTFILDSVVSDKYRYRTTELESLMMCVTSSGEDAIREEIGIYEILRQKVVKEGKKIMATAKNIAELDVRTAVAVRARKRSYVRPKLTEDSQVFMIEGCRHPVVEERQLDNSRSFVSNDCNLGSNEVAPSPGHFALITGPNMGGKSTFLRQNAIIAIMAQCGMFVPARSAHIGIVDAVYTRIGASDDLARDRSTFMVEMAETAHILRNVTSRSLVIMDEVGRGTSAVEGFALARGICKFLYGKGCRTLFATHYAKLAELRAEIPGMQCLMTSAEVMDGHICFLHHILPGVAVRSHAMEVARLAGIPEEVLAYSESQ